MKALTSLHQSLEPNFVGEEIRLSKSVMNSIFLRRIVAVKSLRTRLNEAQAQSVLIRFASL